MIEFVYGAKGSGKTKRMIDMANGEIENAKGQVQLEIGRASCRERV